MPPASLPHSAVGTRLPSTYRPPGTSSVAPAPNLPGHSGRELGNRLRESGAAQQRYQPPRATGTYKAPPPPPPATYTRGGIPPGNYAGTRPDPFVSRPTYGGKYDPVAFPKTQPYGTSTRPQLPRPAIKPTPGALPRAAARIPKGTAGRAIGGGAVAGVGGAITAGAVLAGGGSVPEAIGAGVGATVGSLAGGAAGAALGATLGPVGAVVGGAVGSAVGGAIGAAVGGAIGEYIDGPDIPTEAIAPPGSPVYGSPPFSGGQAAVEYNITVEYNRILGDINAPCAQGPATVGNRLLSGPIVGVFVEGEPTNRCGGQFYNRIRLFGAGGASSILILNGVGQGTANAPRITDISRTDGQPDTDGDPPPELISPGPQRSPLSAAPGGSPATAPPPVPSPANRPTGDTAPRDRVPKGPLGGPLANPPPKTSQPVDPLQTPQGAAAPGPAPAARPQVRPQPGTSINPQSSNLAGGYAPQPQVIETPDGLVNIEGSPAAPIYWRPLPDGSIETWEYPPDRRPNPEETPEWVKELNPDIELAPQPGTSPAPAFAPIPIPLGMPATGPATKTPTGTKVAPKTQITNPTTNGTNGPAPPPKQYPTSTANKCNCNVPILGGQAAILSQINNTQAGNQADLADVTARLTRIEANQNNPITGFAALQTGQAGILGLMQTVNQFMRKAWETTRIQKVLDVLTFIAVMHNVAMLSRDVGETFGWVASQALQIVGIKDEEDNPIDVYNWFTGSIQSLLVQIFGQELYDDARETWLKASTIVRSASMIIWTMRGIMDATQDLMEWVAENTGKIGNALKRFGVVGERAYPWMSERAQARNRVRARFDKVTGTLENAEDVASSFSMATGNIIEIQDETAELGSQFTDFRESVVNGIPDPWADNAPVETTTTTEATNSQSPDIAATDTARG